jgi:hypothetical protein
MLRIRLTNLIKFLVGVLIVQGVTVLLVITAGRTSLDETALLFLVLGVGIGALAAMWFAALADASGQRALAHAREAFARQGEKLRVRADQERIREVRDTRRQVERAERRNRVGTSLKTGLMIGGAMGLAGVMLLTQFVTLGLLLLATAGGAAVGYGLRARQERRANGRRLLVDEPKGTPVATCPGVRESLPAPRERSPAAPVA